MESAKYLKKSPINTTSLAKSMLIGAGLAFIVISIFVFGADKPNPAWGKFWMIRPLLITPLSGAVGGAFFFLMRSNGGTEAWKKVLMIAIGIIGFIIALWLGIVLGLDGTMWD